MIDIRVRLPDEFRDVTEEEMKQFYGKYNEILGVYEHGRTTLEQLLKEMEQSNVSRAVIHAEYEFGERPSELNKRVANIVKQYPNKFSGFGTIDLTRLEPLYLMKQVEEIYG